MYRVWYWQYGVLHMTPIGDNMGRAWSLLMAYFNPPNYLPWLEYIKETQ